MINDAELVRGVVENVNELPPFTVLGEMDGEAGEETVKSEAKQMIGPEASNGEIVQPIAVPTRC